MNLHMPESNWTYGYPWALSLMVVGSGVILGLFRWHKWLYESKWTVPRFSVDPDITRAATIPSEFYTSASVFEEAKEKIFARSWQFVGDL
ncbi:hypothetical protein ABTL71_19010, partial [Acinetobacter baumannii]